MFVVVSIKFYCGKWLDFVFGLKISKLFTDKIFYVDYQNTVFLVISFGTTHFYVCLTGADFFFQNKEKFSR